jgi:hypothetical protein
LKTNFGIKNEGQGYKIDTMEGRYLWEGEGEWRR